MPLAPGDKLGPYEILAPIGAGGMGEVYRARDPRLGRDVAVKVSTERFSERFEREARVIASLNHPNICTLHDVGPNYLVMELVEGPTLADRIREGAVPLDETLAIAKQIADALEAAHEKGIVHRDLKPGNVKIKPDSVVKVLDFGLAKTGGTPAIPDDKSPTLTMGQTEAGMILGTASYMSPEQAKGKVVDKRSDIYAFGVVVYEMLTCRRLHQGESTTEVLASVIKEEPQWQHIPAQVQRLLRRCLEKDPQKRLRHIGDVMALVDDATASPAAAPPKAESKRWLSPAVAASVVAILGGALLLWAPWRSTNEPGQAVRFEVGPAGSMTFNAGAAMAVSPDGRWMVFQANGEDGITRFWVRSLDGVDLRPLPGTENIGATSPPASWSFDSRWVVFAAGNEGKLKKVDIQGGPPQIIADWPNSLNGASWNADGIIVGGAVRAGVPILKVSASGGQATPVTALAANESNHLWPQFLPDGKHFLYERVSSDTAKAGVYVGSIDVKPEGQSTERLLASDRQAYYAALPGANTGNLIFMRGDTLMAQPFDPSKLMLSGEPVAIADRVDSYSARNYGVFSVSNTGALAYRTGSGPQTRLTWFDLQGNPAGTIGDPGDYANPAISPDGSRVAVAMGAQPNRDIWILDVARGTSTRFTFDPARDDFPTWSPDSKTIAFSSSRGGQLDLYSGPADSPGQEKLLLHTDEPKDENSWSKDGRFLVFTSINSKTARDIWALPLSGEAKPVTLVRTEFLERRGTVSPDGRWLAYLSQESGTAEIYVRPFTVEAGAAPKWLVSKGGGVLPRWRSDGKVLYYISTAAQMMAVDLDTSKGLRAETPRRLFAASPLTLQGWDLAPDGKRFLFIAQPGSARVIPFTVVLNWATTLKR
ncbi:MAG TPA: protein kinase [Bryobacteraceae bacterium]|jgi:serine/threonine protein kinase|nr:protein kinase [Bryobacteraceae bacterium]